MRHRIIICLCLVSISVYSFISCSANHEINEPKVFFDSSRYSTSKALWESNKSDNYSFDFMVKGSTGVIVAGQSIINDGSNDTILKMIENRNPEQLRDTDKEKEVKSITERGFLLSDIKSIFSLISKLDAENREYVEKYKNDVKSVSLLVSYNDYGVPISIETRWEYSSMIDGLRGPDVYIDNFKLL